jgi:hypothetical protein
MYGLVNENDRLAGIGLALTTIRPHIAILLAVPFIFKRRKTWWWFALAAAVLALFSVALIGLRGAENYLRMLTISASGEGYKINEFAMVNFIGLLRRLVPDMPGASVRLVGWIVYACAVVLLCVLWMHSEDIGAKQIGLAVLIAIFAVPHLHYHDLVLLLIPIFSLMMLFVQRGLPDLKLVAVFPLAVSWVLVISNFLPALKFSVPYLLGLLIAIILWRPSLVFRR